jgi:hypothetical protein
MIRIEGHWETLDTLHDVSRVIREYYNRELADEMDRLIEEQEEYIVDLKNEIMNLDNLLEYEMNNKGED